MIHVVFMRKLFTRTSYFFHFFILKFFTEGGPSAEVLVFKDPPSKIRLLKKYSAAQEVRKVPYRSFETSGVS